MNRLKPELIWKQPELDELEINIDFHKHTLCVKFFTFSEKLNELYDEFIRYIDPFVCHYPWNIESPQFDKYTHNGLLYGYGELVFDENINDEWLLIHLCWEFSRANSGVFFSFWDSLDNELLLVQAYDVIQTWMDPSNSCNRTWVAGGEILIVAPDNHNYMSMESILDCLKKGDFERDTKLTDYYKDWLKQAESYFLEMIYDVPLNLPKVAVSIFAQKPFLISRAIQISHTEKLQLRQNISSDNAADVKLAVPLLSLSIVKENELKYEGDDKMTFKSIMESMLILGLDLISREEPEALVGVQGEKNEQISPSRDFLQGKLIAMNRLPGKIEEDKEELSKLLQYVPNEANPDSSEKMDNEIIDKLTEFFEDQTAGFEGINNQKDEETPESESENELKDIHELENELGEDFSDFIDFCIEQKKDQKSTRKRKISGWKDYNNDSEYHTDTSLEYYSSLEGEEGENESFLDDPRFKKLLQDENSTEALAKLVSAMKTDDGPGHILLEQAMKNSKR